MQKALFPGYTVGPDAYEDIVNICSAYGKKAAIIGGRKALAAAEPQIRKAVEGSGIEITGTFWYGGEASRENMDMLRPQVADADMIFAVGGGKAIDTCKVLAHNGNLTNSQELRLQLESQGSIFHTTTDSEVIAGSRSRLIKIRARHRFTGHRDPADAS